MGQGRIFVRERRKMGEKEKQPRFAIAAVSDIDLKLKAMHFRKQEIEEIANLLGAEVVYLKSHKDGENGNGCECNK